jgi:hypothetical protein
MQPSMFLATELKSELEPVGFSENLDDGDIAE